MGQPAHRQEQQLQYQGGSSSNSQVQFVKLENSSLLQQQQPGPSSTPSIAFPQQSCDMGKSFQPVMAMLRGGREAGESSQQPQEFYQLVQIPAESSVATAACPEKGVVNQQQPQQHFVLQLPESVQLSSCSPLVHCSGVGNPPGVPFAISSSGHPIPLQVMSLGEGNTALIPVGSSAGGIAPFQLATTADGHSFAGNQGFEFVSAGHFVADAQQNKGFIEAGEQGGSSSDLLAVDGIPEASNQVEPIYVNEKQYARILKRRAARAKLEMEGRIPKQRRKYLHESRHRHAQNRARKEGGKFDSGGPQRMCSSAGSSMSH